MKYRGVYEVNELAARWFEQQLREHPARAAATREIIRRCATDAACAFRVGYAPADPAAFAEMLETENATCMATRTRLLEFRHALVLPVCDAHTGRVVGFRGRTLGPLDDGVPRRAIVSSFDHGIGVLDTELFGCFQARHGIEAEGYAIVVESILDVVSLHSQGITNVVAPLGSNGLNPDAVWMLKTLTPRVAFLFDADVPGRNAAFKGCERCEGMLDAVVVMLPHRASPVSFTRRRGPNALRTLLGQALEGR